MAHIMGMLSMFEVVAEPSRRRILDLLREENRAVGDLVTELGLTQPAVSKHLKVLRDAGLVSAEIDAQRRLYRLNAAPLRELDAWVAPYRRHWSKHLDDLERHLASMPDEAPKAAQKGRTKR
jgi:DNA-binding transcriptional ArsR family regulator